MLLNESVSVTNIHEIVEIFKTENIENDISETYEEIIFEESNETNNESESIDSVELKPNLKLSNVTLNSILNKSIPRKRKKPIKNKECPQCDKKFVSNYFLREHMTVHTGKTKFIY